jgi:hypothetical protein
VSSLIFSQQHRLVTWLPGVAAGILSWLAFIFVGHTSLIRASGLAVVIIIMAMTLRRWGAALTIIGGLALAFSPAFWSQTGGTDSLNLPTTLLLVALATLIIILMTRVGDWPYLGLVVGVGLVIFTVTFWGQIITPRSLRLTTLLAAGMLYLLVQALYITHPRPDELPPAGLNTRHLLGLLLCFGIGVINDPLFTLLAPSVVLGLLLSRTRLPGWYWLLMVLFIAIGVYGVVIEYVNSTWWYYPAAQAEAQNLRVPYVMADGWHEASRWIYLFNLVIGQFGVPGVILGVLGLARLARWYPPLGSVTMIAYAAFAIFGLVYFGRNSAVLLLPLLMIQVFWMTYAVYTFGEWLKKSFQADHPLVRWFAPAAYVLLPLLMLLRITEAP